VRRLSPLTNGSVARSLTWVTSGRLCSHSQRASASTGMCRRDIVADDGRPGAADPAGARSAAVISSADRNDRGPILGGIEPRFAYSSATRRRATRSPLRRCAKFNARFIANHIPYPTGSSTRVSPLSLLPLTATSPASLASVSTPVSPLSHPPLTATPPASLASVSTPVSPLSLLSLLSLSSPKAYILSMIVSPNSDVFTSVAPSIRRAKS